MGQHLLTDVLFELESLFGKDVEVEPVFGANAIKVTHLATGIEEFSGEYANEAQNKCLAMLRLMRQLAAVSQTRAV